MAKARIGSILLLIILCLSGLLSIGCNNTDESEITSVSSPGIPASYPEIDDYIHQQMLVDNIPGLAVVVVQGDEVVYCKGFGISSVETNQPVTPQTIFDLASVTKSFTALGVYISGVSLLIILFLWALLLAFKGLFTRRSKELA